ncbi:MAG: hypothetical protein V1844_03375 [Pseudomonadota bacterium]
MIHKLMKMRYTIAAFVLVLSLSIWTPSAAEDWVPAPLEPQLSSDGNTLYNATPAVVVRDDPNPPASQVNMPARFDMSSLPETATASFSITYVPSGGTDPWGASCSTFPEEAKAAFNAAAGIWGNLLQSSVPITINACWSNLGATTTLGYSGGGPLHRNFSGAPQTNTWYGGSLANALAGSDLSTSSYDMNITYNSNFSWYYGTDGMTPSGESDLMSVVLHEIAHGLNFMGSMSYSGGSGSWGYGTIYPGIYDTFIRDGSGNLLINTGSYANPSTALGSALTSNNIWFHGTQAMAANGGQRVKMYAPSTWKSGSSYSHLDYDTFAGGTNRLMVFAISSGTSTHDPGPVTLGLFKDLGWPSAVPPPSGNSTLVSNSIGSRNTIKISDMSGTLPAGGGAITVSAWDVNGSPLVESGWAAPLTLYNHGTSSITGSALAARFPSGVPMLYKFSVDSAGVVITNVKNSTNDTFKVPVVYSNGVTQFVSNAIGNYNTIKISDLSGSLPAGGGAVTVSAWDANGSVIPESGWAAPLKLYNHGTTIISGSNLAARFPMGSPIVYQFDVQSTQVLITNVKNSTDGKLNVPIAYTSGVSNFVSNSIGNYNTLEISDLSGTLPYGGAAFSVMAWDANGNALPESGSAVPLILYNHGTTSISGASLAARFPSGSPLTYSFFIQSSKLLITNVKSSTDGLVEIPSIYTSGISNFATNYVSSLNTIKISDTSGALTASGAAIGITAWDSNGNALSESGSAAPLKLYNFGTTSIAGSDLAARFPSGFPVLYEFSIGSSSAIVTSLTTSVDGTIKTPTVFTIGSYGGI